MKKITFYLLFICLSYKAIQAQEIRTVIINHEYYYIQEKQLENKNEKLVTYWTGVKGEYKVSEGKTYFEENEGKWTYWYKNGQTKSEGIFEKGLKTGVWVSWYQNGNKIYEGAYQYGDKVGEWNYWYDGGQTSSKGNWEKGKKTGVWVYYYQNGQMKSQGSWSKGKKVGEWTYWNPKGRVYYAGKYKNGERNGYWVRYFREGEREIYYKKGEIVGKRPGFIVNL